MEFYGKKTLLSLLDEERRSQEPPTQLSFKTHQQTLGIATQSGSSSASVMPFYPLGRESPWTLSPLNTYSPSSALLCHCVASLHRHDGNVFSIAVSKGLVITGSESNRIRIWRQPECIDRGFLKSSSGVIRAILTHGNMLFTAHKDLKIRVWNVYASDYLRSKKIDTFPRKYSFFPFPGSRSTGHQGNISCMAYYHAEGLLYTGSWDKTVKAWRLADKKCVDSFAAHEDNVNSIVVNQDDGCLFTASSDGSVKTWRRVDGESSHTLTMILKFQHSPVNALALSSSSSSCYLYSGSSDGFVNFWEKEAMSGRFNHGGFLQGHRFAVLCLVAIERLVFSGSEDTTIRVWRREEGSSLHACLAVMEGHRGPVRCLAACLEMQKLMIGFLVYSAGFDRTVKVWRVKTFAGEKKASLDDGEKSYMKVKMMEYEMSPVLSPTWVEKKLQVSHY